MNLIFKLHNTLEKDYAVMYYVVICMYKEYQLIIMGKLSKNIFLLLSLYVLCNINDYNSIIIFIILLLNTLLMEYIDDNVWFKVNYPTTHKILLDALTVLNTYLILNFLYSILFKIIIPHVEKVWNHVLNMLNGGNNKNNSFNSNNNPEPDGNPNPENELKAVISEQKEKKTDNIIKGKQKDLDSEQEYLKKEQIKKKWEE